MFGIFTAGLLVPSVKSKHILIGASAGLFTVVWIVLRAQTDIAMGVLTFETKDTSVEGCSYTFNVTDPVVDDENTTVFSGYSKPLHHISYLYYVAFGSLVTLGVAVLSTLIVKPDDETVDPQLLATFIKGSFWL